MMKALQKNAGKAGQSTSVPTSDLPPRSRQTCMTRAPLLFLCIWLPYHATAGEVRFDDVDTRGCTADADEVFHSCARGCKQPSCLGTCAVASGHELVGCVFEARVRADGYR